VSIQDWLFNRFHPGNRHGHETGRTHFQGSRDAGFGIKPLTQRGTVQNQSELVSVLGRKVSMEACEKWHLGLADDLKGLILEVGQW
jgi:hypothetical protein